MGGLRWGSPVAHPAGALPQLPPPQTPRSGGGMITYAAAAQGAPRPPTVDVKAPSPLLGFNNNVRHKGRVFHIQTEDSGVRHPHVITHLFADGGRILKTTKTSYAEHIGHDKLAETVRAMMQEQHKAMFI